jgi:hypothetical protein
MFIMKCKTASSIIGLIGGIVVIAACIPQLTETPIPSRQAPTVPPSMAAQIVIPTWTLKPTRAPAPYPAFGPTADLSAQWLTFTDPQHTYSFQYPQGAGIRQADRTTIIQVPISYPPQAWLGLYAEIDAYIITQTASLDQIYQAMYASSAIPISMDTLFQSVSKTPERLTRAGADAVKAYIKASYSYQVLALHHSRLYVFTLDGHEGQPPAPEEQELFDEIIGTVRFWD